VGTAVQQQQPVIEHKMFSTILPHALENSTFTEV